MIKGVHTMFYSSEEQALREFIRDKLIDDFGNTVEDHIQPFWQSFTAGGFNTSTGDVFLAVRARANNPIAGYSGTGINA